jgi:glycosyltransferase involved in cell wall biosynthesis
VSVTVVIPVRNRSALVARAVASVQAAPGEVEIVVVDDASDDETPAALAALHRRGAIQRVITLDARGGANAARWAGVGGSDADFIAFLDSDAVWMPWKLDLQLRAIADLSVDAHVVSSVDVTTSRRLQRRRRSGRLTQLKDLVPHNPVDFPALVVRRTALHRAMFDPARSRFQDWQLAFDLIAQGTAIEFDSSVGVLHLASADRISSDFAAGARERRTMMRKYGAVVFRQHPWNASRWFLDGAARAAIGVVQSAGGRISGSRLSG